ncbi:flagellar motor switch phosphatase FliY [Thermoanaerobacterium sp. RBIITD]|uniref:flagellar motor switch phosphatase FliY n=1 Tax=Thermoanaerobacterium sp. RBIITD TaxID=1550240 RepID=UPI000BB73C2F|nr:flagellar motor switch phosphatase FliY [Thermoanaerobacterium sp. RBIITD]SNX55508.1 flagellar motor switch protein FliN/FliY [Thermoanaerobacterium sp. RBIITD]
MSDFLSQEEINALLSGINDNDTNLTEEEQDVLGEIGNISFGTSATTLFTLLRNKVTITTPKVSIINWTDLKNEFKIPYVGVEVEYTEGLKGHNLLILKEQDVLRITDLMMGGNGDVSEGEINDLHLSAIGEAMNQMIGSSSTSLSTLLGKNINISPPKAFIVDFNKCLPEDISFPNGEVVKIAFKMVIGNIIDSEIMQLLPITFAKQLVKQVMSKNVEKDKNKSFQEANVDDIIKENSNIDGTMDDHKSIDSSKKAGKVSVKPVIFKDFDESDVLESNGKENINLIMDIPLSVTVELGRTKKLIKDILELNEGSIIELDKLAGEPVDILVNGKFIAKGEVVVIDENFGVRIIDIVKQSKRVNSI